MWRKLPNKDGPPEMAKMQFRAMSETDVGAVSLIEQQIYEFPWSPQNFIDSIRAGYEAHCLWHDYSLLGYLVVMRVVDECHLLNLSVRADMQGKGLGKRLLQWAIDWAQSCHMKGMLLEVRPSNTGAQRLYETTGFKLMGVRKHYYPAAQGREDALVLFKPFHTQGE
ncbi:MAG: ribosomal protein S18-alanine N-acetyltransferase [Limnobacter sp.]|nr:ribosomal protein S18-alanine N-acetyltransferase [Limnobacter sp.]